MTGRKEVYFIQHARCVPMNYYGNNRKSCINQHIIYILTKDKKFKCTFIARNIIEAGMKELDSTSVTFIGLLWTRTQSGSVKIPFIVKVAENDTGALLPCRRVCVGKAGVICAH